MSATSLSILDPVSAVTTPGPSKKRKRRVPVTGAAEDCFACVKNGSTCDRRRPYCSQCLAFGKNCSGYRTPLTWGVGVASRGKLRGLSLPVPHSSSHDSSSSPTEAATPRSAPTADSPKSTRNGETGQSRRKRARPTPIATDIRAKSVAVSLSATPTTPQHFSQAVNGTTWRTTVREQQQQQGQHPKARRLLPQYTSAPRHDDLFPLRTTTGTTFGELPWSAPLAGSQSSNFSPMVDYRSIEDGAYADSSHSDNSFPRWAHLQSLSDLPFGWHSVDDTDFEGTDRRRQRLSLTPQDRAQEITLEGVDAPDVLSHAPVGPCEESYSVNGPDHEDVHAALGTAFTFPQPTYDLNLFSIPPRMSYLLDYYNKAICPVLVAFDGPRNPYRRHILDLATHNPGLQNAIGALTTNNIRMRSLDEATAKSRLDRSMTYSTAGAESRGSASSEEQHYKAMSIDYLNSQLADPSKAKDDSVLATLLILCLFHVCDSGFSKFKTQLAGVQKLLKLRGGHEQSEFVGWVEMFFAWFDVMTSAVNDRETHLQGGTLDLADVSSDLGEVEQFSGCDGRLFKLIARLGRLNLLSQSRPVHVLVDPSPRSSISPPTEQQRTSPPKDFYSLPERWLNPEQRSPTLDEPSTLYSSQPAASQPKDRQAFWQEWQTLRERLHAWRMDEESHLASLPVSQRDMYHMSESFRWSALLYTERLAHPTIPSSSANLQGLVNRGLDHIASISLNSCVVKFMLWPLFITGTECVDEKHRDLVRERCVEIQKESGFYNNASGLEVLERVWRENVGGDARVTGSGSGNGNNATGTAFGEPTRCGVQAFKWRNCMDRVDGEYIVI